MFKLTPEQIRQTAEHFVAQAIRDWEHEVSLGAIPQFAKSSQDKSPAAEGTVTKCSSVSEFHIDDLGSLTINNPKSGDNRLTTLMGRRLIWWPGQIERRRRISIVSSRLRGRKDFHRNWFDALRTIAMRCDAEQECLCICDGTAAAEPVRRAAALFNLPVLRLTVTPGKFENRSDLVQWLQTVMTVPNADVAHNETRAIVSPAYSDGPQQGTSSLITAAADAALIMAGNRIVTLSCRAKGNIHALLIHRLSGMNDGTVMVLSKNELTPPSTMQTLVEAGAVAWLLECKEKNYPRGEIAAAPSSLHSPVAVTLKSSPVTEPADWLCHWTRPCAGPWPDQSSSDYLDALIMGCSSADHSAFAAVMRIIETQTLLTSHLSRGAVSFTEVPLNEFRGRRVYRNHLRRYDFEPWGFAIRRGTLEAIGCREVCYIDNVERYTTTDEAWRMQRATDSSGNVDWTTEREWRLPRALNLKSLPAQDVCLFVDTLEEVQMLQSFCPWQVVRVPD